MNQRMTNSGNRKAMWVWVQRCVLVFAVASQIGLGWLREASAQGPSTTSPETSLAVRQIEPLSGWVDELQALNRRLQERLREFQTDPPKLSTVADLNEAYRLSVRMSRLARRLIEAHEAAGADYLARAETAQKRLRKLAEPIRQDPEFNRLQSRIRKDFVTETKTREKRLGKVRGLVRQGDWDKAEEALAELVDDLPAAGLWLDASLAQQGLELFESDRREVMRGFSRSLQDRLTRSLEESRLTEPPPVDALRQRIERAVQDYQQTPEVVYQGEPLSGPALVRRFIDELAAIQLQINRFAAASSYREQPRSIAVEQTLDSLLDRFPQLVEELARSDAERGGVRSDVLQRYAGYVEVLAPMAARQFDETRVANLQKALYPLANHPEIEEEVQGYRLATEAVLVWRRKMADAQWATLSGEFEPLEQTLQKVSRELTGNEEPFRWTKAPGEVADPLNELVAFLGRQQETRLIRLKSVDASRDENRRGQTTARGGAYGISAVPRVPAGISAGLRRDLLVDSQHPPLTVRAAAALWALENGCPEEVGGPITEIGCEAIAPTWLALTQQNAAYLPVGSLSTRDFRNLDKAICLTVTVQPTWVRYGTVFIRLR